LLFLSLRPERLKNWGRARIWGVDTEREIRVYIRRAREFRIELPAKIGIPAFNGGGSGAG